LRGSIYRYERGTEQEAMGRGMTTERTNEKNENGKRRNEDKSYKADG
jgi:hypothetical protein